MSVRTKIERYEFSVETRLGPGEIRAAGARAVEAGRRFLTNTISEQQVRDEGISYLVRGPGNIVKQMAMAVSWSPLAGGRHRVSLSVGDFLTVRPTFLFIPIGPRTVPAFGSLKRFSQAFQEELGV